MKRFLDASTKATKQAGHLYILSYAFDSFSMSLFSGRPTDGRYMGWWSLAEDPGSGNTSSYVFEEVVKISGSREDEENSKNFDWLREKVVFHNDSVGIIVNGRDFDKNIPVSGFCRIIGTALYWATYAAFRYADKLVGSCDSSLQIVFFSPYTRITSKNIEKLQIYNTTMLVNVWTSFSPPRINIERFDQDSIETYLQDKGALDKSYKSGWYTKTDVAQFRYGYSFQLHICGFYGDMDANSTKTLSNILNDQNGLMYVFYFFEEKVTMRQGVRSMFRDRVVMFEACKKMMLKFRKNTIEIGFALMGFYKDTKFYTSPLAMPNYVKYITLLKNWADNQTNTVIYFGNMDSIVPIYFYQNMPSVGWFSWDSTNNTFTTKREEALKVSTSHYKVNKTLSTGNENIAIVVGVMLVVFVLVLLVVIFVLRKYHKKNILSIDEQQGFFNGDESDENEIFRAKYDKEKYEILSDKFTLDENQLLGSGEFAKVYRGILLFEDGELGVAVKTNSSRNFRSAQLRGFLAEIKVLAYLGKHENITELVGANTSSLSKNEVYIFLELCQLGSIEKYLRDIKSLINLPQSSQLKISASANKYINMCTLRNPILDASLSNDLYRWCTQICNGMAYLAEKHVVHADLATRNVLLNLRREAKICDFGLSRRMYNYKSYGKSGQEPLPWKWMSPEALRYMKFNEKTDVWAYGVTIWEMYSLGSTPYAGLSWDQNFPQMLERGFRLGEPEFVERDMYAIMKQCWNIDQEKRPTFSNVLARLTDTNDDGAIPGNV